MAISESHIVILEFQVAISESNIVILESEMDILKKEPSKIAPL